MDIFGGAKLAEFLKLYQGFLKSVSETCKGSFSHFRVPEPSDSQTVKGVDRILRSLCRKEISLKILPRTTNFAA